MAKRRRKPKKARRRPEIAWPEVLGQAVLLPLVFVVPIVINVNSANVCDIKDVVLGLGVALGLSLWLFTSLVRGRLSWVASPLNPLTLAFLAWAGVSVSYSQYWHASISAFARLAAQAGTFYLAMCSLRSARQVRRVIGVACAATLVVSAYGFVQAAGRDPLAWSLPVSRVFSFLGNPTYLGSFLVLIIPVAVAAAWHSGPLGAAQRSAREARPGHWTAAFFLTTAALAATCLYFSVTLAAVIGLALGTAVAVLIVLLGRGRAGLRVTLTVLAVVAVLTPLAWLGYRALPSEQQARVQAVIRLQDPYGEERRLHWRVALDIFRGQPLIGRGYGAFKVSSLGEMSSEWYLQEPRRSQGMLVPGQAHNEYLQILSETGIVGGAIFLLLLLAVCRLTVRASLHHPVGIWRHLSLGIMVAFTAFLFQNIFGVTFRRTGPVMLFWLWLAVVGLASAHAFRSEEDTGGVRVRERRLRMPAWALVLTAVLLACLLAALTAFTVRPLRAGLVTRQAQSAAITGKFATAATLAERAISLDPYSYFAYYTLAYARGQLGQYEQSLEANQMALRLLPDNASVYYNMGVTYKHLGHLQEAEKSFRRAIELEPTAPSHQAAMAELRLTQGRLSEAEQYALAAAKLDPRSVPCCLLLADIAARQGDKPKMLKHVRRASRLAPTDARVQQQLVDILLRAECYDVALDASQRWCKLEPDSAHAWAALGTSQFNLERYEAARQSFVRALKLDPEHAKARLGLAYSCGRLGDYRRARQELERIVRTSPGTPEAQEAQHTLDLWASASRTQSREQPARSSTSRPPAPSRRRQ